MSVAEPERIDVIGIDANSGVVTLAISDHLDWTDERRHLELLQDKINAYLRFVESGEIVEKYPKAKGRAIVIEIVAKFDLCESAREFVSAAKEIVEGAGLQLRFRLFRAEV